MYIVDGKPVNLMLYNSGFGVQLPEKRYKANILVRHYHGHLEICVETI